MVHTGIVLTEIKCVAEKMGRAVKRTRVRGLSTTFPPVIWQACSWFPDFGNWDDMFRGVDM